MPPHRVTLQFSAPRPDADDGGSTSAPGAASGLAVSLLENIHAAGRKTVARCPACAETGDDKGGNHLTIFSDGRFACIQFQGADGAAHRRRIFALVGTRQPHGGAFLHLANTSDTHRRPTMPFDLRPGRLEELHLLAQLRNLNVNALAAASERGLLRFGTLRDGNAPITVWIVTGHDRRNAQARRLDELPWQSLQEKPKAKTLFGSQAAWPVGIGEAKSFPCIALVEGGPDLLAAFHFALCEGLQDRVAPVAMMGAGLTITADALPMFAGKRVRIFPHLDEAGQEAAARWERQLVDAGADVDCLSLAGARTVSGSAVKDLNDLSSLHPDDFEADRDLWRVFDFAEVHHE